MSVVAASLAGSVGLNVGYCASARMRPVCGCITTIEQVLAPAALISAAHCCSAYHWMSAWTVSRRLSPGTGDLTICSVCGMGCWVGPSSTCSLPSRPASSELYSCSSPAAPVASPVAPAPVNPTRLAARSPFG